ncbi:MAG: hypothetical protein A2283_16825 [Lentisphaerae bacterium RIFOXYA12_FULL_48_11]|nr:MAG: hypothetical protein A2283_16825 [Lentisphaerae bacterium RIFOXYA12_FULL_48_11]
MRTLILITTRFPYLPGEEFMEAEVPYLASKFDRMVIVPTLVSGKPRGLPPRVEVETGLASMLSISRASKLFLLTHHLSLFGNAMLGGAGRPLAMYKAMRNAARIAICEKWFSTYLMHRVENSEKVLFFCWWTALPILGARLASRGWQNVVGIVSRAQRSDLYIEEGGDPNWPFHERVLRSLDRVFVASEHGVRYLTSRYPWMTTKAEVGRLGAADVGVKEPSKTSTPFVVCSCAYLNPVKRVDLLIRGLGHVGTKFPRVMIQWHHFGDGPLRAELENIALACLPGNVVATFHGRVDNAQVRSFYRNTFVNLFINTSSSEGVPVSIMEAQSAGIPVIATAVCGTPELVNASNGFLLTANPDVAEVAAAIGAAITEPSCWLTKREVSRKTWLTLSDATKNYGGFAHRLGQFFDVLK